LGAVLPSAGLSTSEDLKFWNWSKDNRLSLKALPKVILGKN
jgi:hypothetical protein